jgi:hypothetical protein
VIVPHFEHLRLELADALQSDAERNANYTGMRARLQAGDHRETRGPDDSI